MEWSGVEQSKGRRERREPNNEQEKKLGEPQPLATAELIKKGKREKRGRGRSKKRRRGREHVTQRGAHTKARYYDYIYRSIDLSRILFGSCFYLVDMCLTCSNRIIL